MSYMIEVENIKCGGCANSITNKLTALPGIDSVDVDIDEGRITLGGDESQREIVAGELLKMGYPETGTAEGMKAAAAKAKSFVSCAIGRLDK